jgi:hypothetical protein
MKNMARRSYAIIIFLIFVSMPVLGSSLNCRAVLKGLLGSWKIHIDEPTSGAGPTTGKFVFLYQVTPNTQPTEISLTNGKLEKFGSLFKFTSDQLIVEIDPNIPEDIDSLLRQVSVDYVGTGKILKLDALQLNAVQPTVKLLKSKAIWTFVRMSP